MRSCFKGQFPIRLLFRLSLVIFCVALLFPTSGVAGAWKVNPIRLEFAQAARSGVLTVTNEGEEPLTIKVEAFEWLQDADAKDHYEESSDLIFFPKTLVIGPGTERAIRAGIKIPAVSQEKTYRLFIEEDPSGRKPSGTGVALAMRFGVPIFSKPVKEAAAGELGPLNMKDGVLQIPVSNKGNVHFRIKSIQLTGRDADGKTIFDQELNGWYLLHGASRTYTSEVPATACPGLRAIDILVQTDRIELNGTINVDKAMCLSQEPKE